ncbi:MAG: hypothetical protein PHS16_03210 [Candidatus Colwellbacteria bacterium]|nr:hypothetical protein [Candidatus Paceibacterota bacterium]MDD3752913.1 hypothetical protein [Candidatus Colwellbacteria bacterium]MDD4201200.1 hypothetical protein [Candidatus Paceibacterota bacterium]
MKKAFIQIPLLIGIIIASIVISGAGAGYVLYEQKKLDSLTASVSQIPTEEELNNTDLEKVKTEEDQEEINPELEALRLETERNKTENEILKEQLEEQRKQEDLFKKQQEAERLKQEAEKLVQNIKEEQEKQDEEVLKIDLVSFMIKDEYLRIGWMTNMPTESNIKIWPIHEVAGNFLATSSSRSSVHYVDIRYNYFPIYSIGIDEIENYTNYNYIITAKNGDNYRRKEGTFTLDEKINNKWAIRVSDYNKEKHCDKIDAFNGLQKLFCKNYRGYNGF